jgi:hypothetical protein
VALITASFEAQALEPSSSLNPSGSGWLLGWPVEWPALAAPLALCFDSHKRVVRRRAMAGTRRSLRQQIGGFFSGLTGLLAGAAALIGAVVGILTAFGIIGGSSGSPAAAGALSQATWASKANTICATANDTARALPEPTTISKSDIAGYMRTVLILHQRMLRDLNALPAPKGKEAEVDAFLRIGAESSDALNDIADDVAVGNLADLPRPAALLSRVNTRFNNAAIALGARTCAEGSSLKGLFGG